MTVLRLITDECATALLPSRTNILTPLSVEAEPQLVAVPTMGALRCLQPMEPSKGAVKVKMPPVGAENPVHASKR